MSVIPQTPRASRGLRPLAPYQGSALDPLGMRSPDPSPTHAPLILNPGSTPDYVFAYMTLQYKLSLQI